MKTLAGALHEQGLRPGERVGMLGLNSDRYAEYLYGVLCKTLIAGYKCPRSIEFRAEMPMSARASF